MEKWERVENFPDEINLIACIKFNVFVGNISGNKN